MPSSDSLPPTPPLEDDYEPRSKTLSSQDLPFCALPSAETQKSSCLGPSTLPLQEAALHSDKVESDYNVFGSPHSSYLEDTDSFGIGGLYVLSHPYLEWATGSLKSESRGPSKSFPLPTIKEEKESRDVTPRLKSGNWTPPIPDIHLGVSEKSVPQHTSPQQHNESNAQSSLEEFSGEGKREDALPNMKKAERGENLAIETCNLQKQTPMADMPPTPISPSDTDGELEFAQKLDIDFYNDFKVDLGKLYRPPLTPPDVVMNTTITDSASMPLSRPVMNGRDDKAELEISLPPIEIDIPKAMSIDSHSTLALTVSSSCTTPSTTRVSIPPSPRTKVAPTPLLQLNKTPQYSLRNDFGHVPKPTLHPLPCPWSCPVYPGSTHPTSPWTEPPTSASLKIPPVVEIRDEPEFRCTNISLPEESVSKGKRTENKSRRRPPTTSTALPVSIGAAACSNSSSQYSFSPSTCPGIHTWAPPYQPPFTPAKWRGPFFHPSKQLSRREKTGYRSFDRTPATKSRKARRSEKLLKPRRDAMMMLWRLDRMAARADIAESVSGSAVGPYMGYSSNKIGKIWVGAGTGKYRGLGKECGTLKYVPGPPSMGWKIWEIIEEEEELDFSCETVPKKESHQRERKVAASCHQAKVLMYTAGWYAKTWCQKILDKVLASGNAQTSCGAENDKPAIKDRSDEVLNLMKAERFEKDIETMHEQECRQKFKKMTGYGM